MAQINRELLQDLFMYVDEKMEGDSDVESSSDESADERDSVDSAPAGERKGLKRFMKKL
jgi:hypothetical protein